MRLVSEEMEIGNPSSFKVSLRQVETGNVSERKMRLCVSQDGWIRTEIRDELAGSYVSAVDGLKPGYCKLKVILRGEKLDLFS